MPEGLHREWFGKEIHVVGVRELFGFRFFRRIGQLCCARVVGCLWGWATPISSAIVWHCLAPPKSKGSMEFTFLKVYEHLWRNFERQSSLYFDLGGLLRGNFENTKFFLS